MPNCDAIQGDAHVVAVVLLLMAFVVFLGLAVRTNRQQAPKQGVHKGANRPLARLPLLRRAGNDLRAVCRRFLPIFRPRAWNGPRVRKNNNCLAYAYDLPVTDATSKLQPGQLSGLPPLTDDQLTCANVRAYVRVDRPGAYVSPDEATPCRCGFYKTFFALDLEHPSGERDYHWYRKDAAGVWSHKPGDGDATNRDAAGHPIRNPLLASRNYALDGGHNYSLSCGFLCLPSGGGGAPP